MTKDVQDLARRDSLNRLAANYYTVIRSKWDRLFTTEIMYKFNELIDEMDQFDRWREEYIGDEKCDKKAVHAEQVGIIGWPSQQRREEGGPVLEQEKRDEGGMTGALPSSSQEEMKEALCWSRKREMNGGLPWSSKGEVMEERVCDKSEMKEAVRRERYNMFSTSKPISSNRIVQGNQARRGVDSKVEAMEKEPLWIVWYTALVRGEVVPKNWIVSIPPDHVLDYGMGGASVRTANYENARQQGWAKKLICPNCLGRRRKEDEEEREPFSSWAIFCEDLLKKVRVAEAWESNKDIYVVFTRCWDKDVIHYNKYIQRRYKIIQEYRERRNKQQRQGVELGEQGMRSRRGGVLKRALYVEQTKLGGTASQQSTPSTLASEECFGKPFSREPERPKVVEEENVKCEYNETCVGLQLVALGMEWNAEHNWDVRNDPMEWKNGMASTNGMQRGRRNSPYKSASYGGDMLLPHWEGVCIARRRALWQRRLWCMLSMWRRLFDARQEHRKRRIITSWRDVAQIEKQKPKDEFDRWRMMRSREKRMYLDE